MVNSLLRYNTLENLFTTHPPFQIDGNLGIVGAICEMLVQNDSGGVFLLPVDLPDWPDGSFSGLRVYGGFVVSAQWKQGRLVRAEIKAVRSDTLKLRTRTPMVWSQVWPQYRLVEGTEHPYDVGLFGDHEHFAYIAGFGAFTDVSYATPQDQKKVLGHLAYVLQGMQQLPKIEPIHTRVEYDGGVFDGMLLYGSVTNSTSVAGIVRLPEEMVSLGDGVSELVLVRDPGNVAAFAEIVSSVLSERFDSEYLLILQTKRAAFHFDKPVAWTRDGEEGGTYTDIEIVNHKCPVQLIF